MFVHFTKTFINFINILRNINKNKFIDILGQTHGEKEVIINIPISFKIHWYSH